jgi:hypothetical protein
MFQITEKLFLSGYDSAHNLQLLIENNIQVVISLIVKPPDKFYLDSLKDKEIQFRHHLFQLHVTLEVRQREYTDTFNIIWIKIY